jgi:hypothetical protein
MWASTVDKLGTSVMGFIDSTGRLPATVPAGGGSSRGWSDRAVVAKLDSIERAISAIQMQVRIGDETITRSARRGEKLISYRG